MLRRRPNPPDGPDFRYGHAPGWRGRQESVTNLLRQYRASGGEHGSPLAKAAMRDAQVRIASCLTVPAPQEGHDGGEG